MLFKGKLFVGVLFAGALWGHARESVYDFDALKFITDRDIPKEVRGCDPIKFIPTGYIPKGTHKEIFEGAHKEVRNNEEAIKVVERFDAIKFIPGKDIPKGVLKGVHKGKHAIGETIQAKAVKNETPISHRYS